MPCRSSCTPADQAIEDYVDAHLTPSWQVAQVLTEAYFHSIQGAFRFIEREQFFQDLRHIYNATITTPLGWPQRRTLAVANVMWAIGAKWMEMTQLDRQTHPDNAGVPLVENQLVYYARARSLGLDHRMQVDHPSLETVQGMAILSFYLLSNGSVHKFVPSHPSWCVETDCEQGLEYGGPDHSTCHSLGIASESFARCAFRSGIETQVKSLVVSLPHGGAAFRNHRAAEMRE